MNENAKRDRHFALTLLSVDLKNPMIRKVGFSEISDLNKTLSWEDKGFAQKLPSGNDNLELHCKNVQNLPLLEGKKVFSADVWELWSKDDNLSFSLFKGKQQDQCLQVLEIDLKTQKATLFATNETLQKLNSPLDQLIFQVCFARNRELLIHSCAFSYNGLAYLVPAESGVGKTTLLKTLKQSAKGFQILCDEKNLLKVQGEATKLSSTPWHGEMEEVHNATLPLGGILFLERGHESSLRPITIEEASQRLLETAMLPHWHPEFLQDSLNTFEKVLQKNSNRLFALSFDKTQEVADVIGDLAGG